MDLKGAEVRNFYKLSSDIGVNDETIGIIRIPHYQRPYKWNKDLVKQLIQDWSLENIKSKDGEYFAGSVVTVSTSKVDGLMHQLIDGQQRFTTIYLTNFLLFLLVRIALREALSGKQSLIITSLLERLSVSVKFSVTKELGDILNMDDIADAFQCTDQDSQEKLQVLLENYCHKIYLPNVSEADDKYKDEYIQKLRQYMECFGLRLSYDRDSYNASLCSALSRVVVTSDSQHPISIDIDISDLKDGCIELVYLEAVQQIFDSFSELSKNLLGADLTPLKYSSTIINTIATFLKSVKLCVIQTGNQDDAYTLFEVLNDRALALDDLDLVKNQFYRYLCISSKNTDIKDEDLDKEIVLREEQWGDKIFKNTTDTNKKLIAYLSTSYITGSTKVGLKSHDKFRDEIKKYLEDKNESYSSIDLNVDFNIFECIRFFLDTFQVKANNRVYKALEAEFSDNTITYKTIHLLLALGLEGVLAGLVNFIMQYIKLNVRKDFNPDLVLKVFNELVSNAEKHAEVHKQARIIWKLVLISPDYKGPKKLANNIIKANSEMTSDLIYQAADLSKSELSTWLSAWRYSSNEVRVRILFARLLQLELDNGQLKKTTFSFNLKKDDIQKLHLDHMEPSNPEGAIPDAYYKLGQIDRGDDINALGNMFPLPGSENINKSNKPMYTVFDFLNNAGLKNHWLTTETKKQFDKNCENKSGVNVPKQQFFTERKEYLIQMFEKAIKL